MASSELSVTLSISQLLQFQVCAGLGDGQPSLQLETAPQPSFGALFPDLSSVDIKIETQCVDGQRILRVFATHRPDQSNVPHSPSLLATSVSNSLHLGTPCGASPSSNPSSTAASPAAFDFCTQEALMNSYDSFFPTFSVSEMPASDYLPEQQPQLLTSNMASHAHAHPHVFNPPLHGTPYSPSDSTPSTASTPASSTSIEEDVLGPRQRPRRFACLDPSCPRRFSSKYTLRLHMTTHQQTHKARYQCEMGCSETFSRQHDRLRHEVARHGRVSEWTCNRCKHVFSSQSTQNKHKCPDFITADNSRS